MNSDRHSPQLRPGQSSEKWRRIRGLLKYSFPALLISLVKFGRTPSASHSPIRIMIVRADGLGDFIMFIPFLRCLRVLYPEAYICLVVGRNVLDVAEACPYVNEVLSVSVQRSRFSIGHLRYLSSFAKQNLRGRFDLALQPRWDIDRQWATLIAWFTRAPRIVGFTEKASVDKAWENWLYDRLLTEVLPAGTALHETERNLEMIRYLGGAVDNQKLEFWFREEDRRAGDKLLKEVEPSGSLPVIVFGVGAGEARRIWPFYAELIRLLLARYSFVPVIIGGAQDYETARRIQDDVSGVRILLSKPLREIAAFLSRCDLFVGNDSGPMHLASAVNLPIVAIFCHPAGGGERHVNSPARFGPWTENATVIRPAHFSGSCSGGCQEAVAHCIRAIKPETVMDEVLIQTKLPARAKTREQLNRVTS